MGYDGSKSSPMGILFLVVLIDMLGFTIVIPFLTYFIQDLASSEGIMDIGRRDLWVGVVISCYSLAQFIFTPILGSLSDNYGRRPIIILGLISNSIFFIVFGLSQSLTMALIARFLAGAGNGNIAVARAYIGDISQPNEISRRMGMIGAAFGLGFTIGPFIGGEFSNPAERWNLFVGTVFDTYPYLLPCTIASALSAGSLILAYYKLPESIDVEALKNNEDERPWGQRMLSMAANSASMLRTPSIGAMIWVSMLFIFGFTVMHSVFILYTEMAVGLGGLGFSEQDNGRIFAMIGLFGILTQAVLIGPLTRRYGTRRLIPISVLLTGIGLTLIPYTQSSMAWIQMLLVVSCIAIGNGVFQPSSSTYLTRIARDEGYDLGVVMGAQESLSAFARIFGPLSGGLVWELTVNGSYPWDYHTAFHLCGVLMVISAILTLRLPPLKQFDEAE